MNNKRIDLNFLISLYNTLSIIETKGENTIIMAKCLEELNKYIKTLQNQNDGEEE